MIKNKFSKILCLVLVLSFIGINLAITVNAQNTQTNSGANSIHKYATNQNEISVNYSKKIKDKIYENWYLGKRQRIDVTRKLKDFELITKVTLDKSGQITDIEILSTNAPNDYVEKSLSAIKMSAPFGPIPYLLDSYKFKCYMQKKGNSTGLSVIQLK